MIFNFAFADNNNSFVSLHATLSDLDILKIEPCSKGASTMMDAAEEHRWRRCKYPLQTPSEGLTQSSLETSSKEDTDKMPSHRVHGVTQSTAVSTADPRAGTADGAEPSSIASQPEVDGVSSSEPSEKISHAANKGNPITPPQTPEKEPEHIREMLADRSRGYDERVPKSTSSRRQVYPMQPSESGFNVQLSTGLEAPEAEAGSDLSPNPIHLPKHTPAVLDSEKQDSTGRTIVVCLDGTGDKFDNDNSNIVHLISALKKDDMRQMTYYQAGVGTYGPGGLSGGLSAAMDMAVGSSLGLHVRDAYHFLMHTYTEGDRICIFGFSRGAYTARCLAGMIHKVGLLPPRNIQQISFAYQFYKDESRDGWKQSAAFKKTFSIDVSVYFLGCFDSVASVGIIPRQLPLSSTPTNKPRYFRHAMALDERRVKFKVCRHEEKDWSDIKMEIESPENKTPLSTQSDQRDAPPPKVAPQSRQGKLIHQNLSDEERKRLTASETPFETDVLEVWFVGAHADIGGGAVSNVERHKLAQIPLRWMIRQAFECNTGILFKTAVLAEHGLDVHMLWPKYKRYSAPTHAPPPSLLEKYEKGLPPRSTRRSKLVPIDKRESGEAFFHLKGHTDEDWTPEQVEDFFDAMSPLNDQLLQAPSWWILEVLPVNYRVPVTNAPFSERFGMNLGAYRGVEEPGPKLHWTVLHRMQHTGYKIEATVASHVKWQTVV